MFDSNKYKNIITVKSLEFESETSDQQQLELQRTRRNVVQWNMYVYSINPVLVENAASERHPLLALRMTLFHSPII